MGKGAAKGALEGAKDGLISGMVMGGVSSGISAMSGNPSFCFVAGTTVLTTLGKKAIETIQVGDTVPCVDHITGTVAEKKVITTTINKVNRLTELEIDGEVIQCTETHPFQVKGKGWVDACDLQPGDVVYTKDWNTATVNSVSLIELEEKVEVFNFEVEDCHTYFVGELGILVHNACSTQKHHIMTNKNKTYTPEFDGIVQKYGLKLNQSWNVRTVSNHVGRHTSSYHDFILQRVKSIDVVAAGNKDVFLKHFGKLADYVVSHPGIMY